jgi:hypothetical protein
MSRLVITGGNQHRLHEEVITSGGELTGSGFTRITQVGRLDELLQNSAPANLSAEIQAEVSERFHAVENQIMNGVESRSRDRLRYLANTLDRRKRQEADDIRTVLSELEATIRKELQEGEMFLPGFLDELAKVEQDQLRLDEAALHRRLERIPEERNAEVEAIERRYADLMDRVFPVAVVFIVPLSTTQKGCV